MFMSWVMNGINTPTTGLPGAGRPGWDCGFPAIAVVRAAYVAVAMRRVLGFSFGFDDEFLNTIVAIAGGEARRCS
jgi:hypothetical protein